MAAPQAPPRSDEEEDEEDEDEDSEEEGEDGHGETGRYPFVWRKGVLNGYSSTRVSLWDSLMFGRLAM